MTQQAKLLSVTLFKEFADVTRGQREFSDTDPQMLYAILQMEAGADPDETLEEVERAEVVFDKFRPRLAPPR